jgi:hypothetical protein
LSVYRINYAVNFSILKRIDSGIDKFSSGKWQRSDKVDKRFLAVVGISLILALAVPSAWALVEHILNGGFEEEGVGGWTITLDGAEATMTRSNSAVRTGAWGAEITNTTSTLGGQGFYTGVRQHDCMIVNNPGTSSHITFSGYIYVPSDAANFGRFRPQVRFYQSTGCATNRGLTSADWVTTIARNEWVPFQVIAPRPADANGAVVYLNLDKTTTEPLVVYFDDLTFYDSTPSSVSLHSIGARAMEENTAVPLFIALALILALITRLWLRR